MRAISVERQLEHAMYGGFSTQGTVGLELLQQVADLDAIVVPVSGGGLISGIAIAAKALKPDIVIIAAEPTGETSIA